MSLGHSAEHIACVGFHMGRRNTCCSDEGLRRGAWTAEEDMILKAYIKTHGEGRWRSLPKKAGLKRCGKSCRLRWLNYLRPDIKRGGITLEEEDLIIRLHKLVGNRWSLIAGRIPGRTDNEIKNYWNTCLKKKVKNREQSTVYSTTMISNSHHFTEENAGRKQFARPDKAQELLAPSEPSLAPQEESWWDLLMSLDAGNGSTVQSSGLNFMSLCEELITTSSAQAKLDAELETLANFFSYERED